MIFAIFLTALLSVWTNYCFSDFSVFILLLFFFIFVIILKVLFGRKVFKICVIAAVSIVFGLYTLSALDTSDMKLSEYESKSCRIYAKVCEIQNENDYFDTYIVETSKITNPYGENETYTKEKAYLRVKNGKNRKLSYGDFICTLSEVDKIKSTDNRGESDYSLSSKADGIFYTITADNCDIKIYSHSSEVKNIYDLSHKAREYIKSIAYENLDEKSAAILCAVTVSERRLLDEETKRNINDAGIAHMSTASGMHTGCIVCIIVFLSGLVGIKRKYATAISVPLIFMYAFINNCTPSIMRASIMTLITVAASFLGRDEDKFISIGAAGTVILIANPLSALDIGFVMSFSCVTSIVLFYEKIFGLFKKLILDKIKSRTILRKVVYYILTTTAVSIAAQIAVLPLSAYYFEKINPYAVISNLLVSWILPCLIFIGIFMCVFGFSKVVCTGFAAMAKIICKYIMLTAKIISGFKFSNIEIYLPFVFIVIYIGLIIVIYKAVKGKRKSACLALALCVVLVIVKMPFSAVPSVNFVNVGQADGCFVKTSLNSAIVIDGGGKNSSDTDKTFVPYMKRSGIKKVEYIFVSHFDADHAKNVLEVIDNFEVSNIVLPYRSEKVKINLRDEIKDKACRYGINVVYASDEDMFDISDNVRAYVYAPPRNLKYFEDENEGSMALKLCVGDEKILFLGDLTIDIQDAMALKYKEKLECDILKVSHHGSFKSYSPGLVYYAKPKYAVISCGDKNIYSHPDEETVLALEKRKICVLTTAENKDIRFYTRSGNIICDCGDERGEN